MKRTLVGALTATAVLLVPSLPAAAIVNGVPDDGEHPYVGQLLYYVPDAVDSRFDDPGGWFTCTGTLLDETTVLTAGHCVYGIGTDGEPTTLPDGALSSTGGTDVWINFLEAPDYSALPPSSTFVPDSNDERYDAWSAVLDADPDWRSATAYHHPEYDDGNFVLHDLGVLVLDEPAPDYATSDGFGVLPEVGLLDRLARVKGQTYEPVGYGLEESGPLTASGGDTRRKATQKLVNLNGVFGYGKGTSAKFSNNQGTNTTGGTCSGDSGGPVLAGDTSHVIVAVTSFGINPTCTGSDGANRVDQADDLAWLATFGVTAP